MKLKAHMKYLLFAVSIFPILLLSFYNFPSADDYSFAKASYQIYVNGGSFAEVMGAVFNRVATMYNTWQGNYTGVFLMSFSPMIIGGRGYFIGTILGMAMLSCGILYFMYQLCVKVFGLDKNRILSIGLLTLFIIFQCMPEGMVRVEGLYWYNSTIYYTFLQGLAYLFMGIAISNMFEKTVYKIVCNTIIAAVLAFLLGGANYLTAIICGIFSFILVIVGIVFICFSAKKGNAGSSQIETDPWSYLKNKYIARLTKGSVYNVLPAIVFFIGFVISVVAPGNALRESDLGGFNPIKAVLISYYYVFSVAMSEWTNWAVCGLFIISIPLWWRAVKDNGSAFRFPLIIVLLLLSFNAATITPALYATGNISAGRIQCIFWIQYVLLMELTIGYLVGFASKFIEIKNVDSKTSHRIFVLAIAMYVCFCILCVIPDRNLFVGTEALNEIASGTAAGYSAENKARLELLENADISDVVIDQHEYQPELLFHSDITVSVDDWTNQAIAEYYGKNSVVLGE